MLTAALIVLCLLLLVALGVVVLFWRAAVLHVTDQARLIRAWAELTAALRVIERLLGDDDPMLYDRADDEVPAMPVPPTVDGFSITGRNQRPTKLSAEGGLGGPAAGMGVIALGGAITPALRGGGLR